jgi:hypothetical protein
MITPVFQVLSVLLMAIPWTPLFPMSGLSFRDVEQMLALVTLAIVTAVHLFYHAYLHERGSRHGRGAGESRTLPK